MQQQKQQQMMRFDEIHSMIYTCLSQRIIENEALPNQPPFSPLYESSGALRQISLREYLGKFVFFYFLKRILNFFDFFYMCL